MVTYRRDRGRRARSPLETTKIKALDKNVKILNFISKKRIDSGSPIEVEAGGRREGRQTQPASPRQVRFVRGIAD